MCANLGERSFECNGSADEANSGNGRHQRQANGRSGRNVCVCHDAGKRLRRTDPYANDAGSNSGANDAGSNFSSDHACLLACIGMFWLHFGVLASMWASFASSFGAIGSDLAALCLHAGVNFDKKQMTGHSGSQKGRK